MQRQSPSNENENDFLHEIEIVNHGYDEEALIEAISRALSDFYNKLIHNIESLDLNKIVKAKNPYLFRAKAMNSASDIVNNILSAFVSSSEETIFGNVFFEPIAKSLSTGMKALANGIDIGVEKDDVIYAIAVKSGPKVFNADSKARQEQNFQEGFRRVMHEKKRYVAIIGYGYGKKQNSGRGKPRMYVEYAGQAFWKSMTGDPEFYVKLIKYMGDMPEKYSDAFQRVYEATENRLTGEFIEHYCDSKGNILWEKLIQDNSGM